MSGFTGTACAPWVPQVDWKHTTKQAIGLAASTYEGESRPYETRGHRRNHRGLTSSGKSAMEASSMCMWKVSSISWTAADPPRRATSAINCVTRIGPTSGRLCCLPYLVQDQRCRCCLVLRQKASVMLLHYVGRILDRVASLLVGSCLLQNTISCGPFSFTKVTASWMACVKASTWPSVILIVLRRRIISSGRSCIAHPPPILR